MGHAFLIDDLIENINSLDLTKQRIKEESPKAKEEEGARKLIFTHFKSNGLKVSSPAHVGFLKFEIDIEYDERIGLEIKLADSLLTNSSEVQRLLGQCYYYIKAKYYPNPLYYNLLVCVIGDAKSEHDPKMKEIKKLVKEMGIKFLYRKIA